MPLRHAVTWASGGGSRRCCFCGRGEDPIYDFGWIGALVADVNQFVNHDRVETGGWPLEQRLSHWEV